MEFTKQDTKIIKGAAICFMLFHHLFAFPERVTEGTFVSLWYFNETNLAVCLGAFGRICVPIFTFLSGYGIYRSSLKSGDCSALAVRHIRSLYKNLLDGLFRVSACYRVQKLLFPALTDSIRYYLQLSRAELHIQQ